MYDCMNDFTLPLDAPHSRHGSSYKVFAGFTVTEKLPLTLLMVVVPMIWPVTVFPDTDAIKGCCEVQEIFSPFSIEADEPERISMFSKEGVSSSSSLPQLVKDNVQTAINKADMKCLYAKNVFFIMQQIVSSVPCEDWL